MKVYLFRKEEMKVNLKNKVVEIENISKLLDIELINDVKIKLDEGHGSTKALKLILCANLFKTNKTSLSFWYFLTRHGDDIKLLHRHHIIQLPMEELKLLSSISAHLLF